MPPRRKPDISIPAEHVKALEDKSERPAVIEVVGDALADTEVVYADPVYDVEFVEYLIDAMPGAKNYEQDGRRSAAKAALKALMNDGYHIVSSTAGDSRSGGAVVVWTLVKVEGA